MDWTITFYNLLQYICDVCHHLPSFWENLLLDCCLPRDVKAGKRRQRNMLILYWGHLQNKNKKVEACPQTKNKRRLKLVLEGDRFYCISFFTFAKLSFSNTILTLLQFKKLDTLEPLQLFVCKFNRYWERNLEINDESLSLSDESYFSYHFFHLSSKLRLYLRQELFHFIFSNTFLWQKTNK